MREIKYQAWVAMSRQGIHRMFDVEGIDWKHNRIKTAFGEYSIIGNVLREYTGLKDKNDVEICEGDILQCDFSFYEADGTRHQEWSVGEVIFQHGGFVVGFGYNMVDGHNIMTGFKIEWLQGGARSEWRDFEVIGNIYENPELLDEHHREQVKDNV